MYNLIRVLVLLYFSAGVCQTVAAGEVSSDRDGYILFSGEIKKGDAEKLAKAFINVKNSHNVLWLDLNSPGGDVNEAMKITALSKALNLSTNIRPGGICASACFFIFLAANQHVADGDGVQYAEGYQPLGKVGLHRPYLRVESNSKRNTADSIQRQSELMLKMTEYLRKESVPQRLIDIMMSHPSNDIYWMTHNDLQELGSYSHGFEELIIARCGYSRHLSSDLWNEQHSQDSNEVAIGIAKQQEFTKCLVSEFPDLKEEMLKNLEKLRKGWRPWNT